MEALKFAKSPPISNISQWLFPENKVAMTILENKRDWFAGEVAIKTSVYLRHSLQLP